MRRRFILFHVCGAGGGAGRRTPYLNDAFFLLDAFSGWLSSRWVRKQELRGRERLQR